MTIIYHSTDVGSAVKYARRGFVLTEIDKLTLDIRDEPQYSGIPIGQAKVLAQKTLRSSFGAEFSRAGVVRFGQSLELEKAIQRYDSVVLGLDILQDEIDCFSVNEGGIVNIPNSIAISALREVHFSGSVSLPKQQSLKSAVDLNEILRRAPPRYFNP